MLTESNTRGGEERNEKKEDQDKGIKTKASPSRIETRTVQAPRS